MNYKKKNGARRKSRLHGFRRGSKLMNSAQSRLLRKYKKASESVDENDDKF